jgi:hypothetical protein
MRAHNSVVARPYGTLSSWSNRDVIQPESVEAVNGYPRPIMEVGNRTKVLGKWTDIRSLRRNKRGRILRSRLVNLVDAIDGKSLTG